MPEYLPLSQASDVFGWLNHLLLHRTIYGTKSLRDLEIAISGYCSALESHGLVEPVPSMGKHFRQWLRFSNDWSEASGWPTAFEARFDTVDRQFDEFQRQIAAYQCLTPIRHQTYQLSAHNQPTGKRIFLLLSGAQNNIPLPDRIAIMQYRPDPLYFLRMHFGPTVTDYPILENEMRYATSVEFAMNWAKDEFGLNSDEWERAT